MNVNTLTVSNSPHMHPSTHSTVGTKGKTCFQLEHQHITLSEYLYTDLLDNLLLLRLKNVN